MGNNIRNCQNQQYQQFTKYIELQKNQRGTILKDDSDAIFIMKQQLILDELVFNQRYKQIKKLSTFSYENILNVIGVDKKQLNNFCASSYKIWTLFEYSTTTLEDEIRIRSTQNRFFEQKDIFNILCSIMNAYKQFKFNKISICPEAIFIMNDGSLKLLNPNLEPQLNQSFSQIYSPERFQCLESLTNNNNFDEEKQIIFSLGLCILSVAVLKNYIDCYDFKEGTFRYSVLQQMLNICRNTYSQRLISLLSHLIAPNPQKRINTKCLAYILALPDECENKIKMQATKAKSKKSCSELENLSKFEDNEQNSEMITNFEKISIENKNICNENKIQDQLERLKVSEKYLKNVTRMPLTTIDLENNNNEIYSIKSSRLSDIKYFETNQSSIRMNQQEVHYFSNKINLNQSNLTKVTYQDGSRYEGNMIQGKKQGNGKYYFKNKVFYEGNFQNDKMHGFGTLYYQENILAYQGNWFQNKFHGQGTLFNQTPVQFNGSFDYKNFQNLKNEWVYYRGNFKFDKKEGNGCIFLSNGEYYQGMFVNDNIQGKGEFHSLNNQVFKGTWKKNKLQ